MQRLTLVAPSSESDRLTRALMWLRCVEVETADPDELGLTRASCDDERNELTRRASMLQSAIATLSEYKTSKKKLFSGRLAVERKRFDADVDKPLKVALETNAASSRIAELRAQKNKKQNDITSLDPWRTHDVPLEFEGTGDTRLTLGILPVSTPLDDIRAGMPEEADGLFEITEISRDERSVYVAVWQHVSCGTRIDRALSAYGFSKVEFRDLRGAPSEAQERLRGEIKEIDRRRSELEAELKEAAEGIAELEIAYDVTKTSLACAEAKQRYLRTESTVYLSAWVPRERIKAVVSELERFECWYDFSDPTEDDQPPVLLNNNAFARPFEGVVAMFSLPRYGSFDPTFIMSIFYFVIFGLMLADVGYGLILTLGCLLLLKLMKPQGGMKQLMQMFMVCGVSCTVAGAAFGSYFGDLIDTVSGNLVGSSFRMPALLNIVENPMAFLYISLGVGLLHLFTGMGIKFYVLCREGKVFSAIFDIGSWYVLFIGIGLIFLVPSVGKWVALAGVAMLVLTQGRAEKNPVMKLLKGVLSLYGIVSYLSDFLSYSRIMALGLASAVIASVVNQVGVMGGFVGIVVALMIGHTLNLAINLLGSYVHTSRLQYIEFFGKFFEDGGRPFAPVAPDMKYTEISDLN
ncbi:MAG: V-type ATP synthase subunit I [Clostridia bacterium]|nr:V-type ATP synthase subunit I [Clostridia bacterium]